MVSKVAVIALVAIVAAPILLGYAFNLSEVTVSEYKTNNDPVNVSPLLKDYETYTMTNADVYQINTKFAAIDDSQNEYPIVPYYEHIYKTSFTSYPLLKGSADNWNGGTLNLTDLGLYYFNVNYAPADGKVGLSVYDGGTQVLYVDYIHYLCYDASTSTITCIYYYYSTVKVTHYTGDMTSLSFTVYTLSNLHIDYGFQYLDNEANNDFVDLSAGFHLDMDPNANEILQLPERTSSYIMTVNLNSVTDNSHYTLDIEDRRGHTVLDKTVTGGDVSWKYQNSNGDWIDLYYDPSRSDNTYQIYREYSFKYESGGYYYYDVHTELRYVGGWPALIGAAEYYTNYLDDGVTSDNQTDNGFDWIKIIPSGTTQTSTPIVRMDNAKFLAFKYYVIADKTYDPAAFRSNPSTKISSISQYGSYITFAGNTYNVDSSGNITMGTHKVSVSNMTFESIPVAGGYANKINGTFISNSGTPSTITFGGTWAATIATSSMELQTHTETDWTPGQFGWDVIDHNFLMVGMLASFGAFIALGIYSRRTNTSIWPLMLVCGGAAVIFFLMM